MRHDDQNNFLKYASALVGLVVKAFQSLHPGGKPIELHVAGIQHPGPSRKMTSHHSKARRWRLIHIEHRGSRTIYRLVDRDGNLIHMLAASKILREAEQPLASTGTDDHAAK